MSAKGSRAKLALTLSKHEPVQMGGADLGVFPPVSPNAKDLVEYRRTVVQNNRNDLKDFI